MSKPDTAGLEPIFISVKKAADMLDVTPWSIYELLKQEPCPLVAQYFGKRRLVRLDSVRAFADNLPTERPETVA